MSRRLVEGAYNERRAATDLALETLGLARLVDVTQAQISSLPPAIQPRVRHVVTENARVLAAAEAIERQDAAAFAALMNEAHASMRDDFEASHSQVDEQVAGALAAGALGARITGAGFGGCYVVLCERDKVLDIVTAMQTNFPNVRLVA